MKIDGIDCLGIDRVLKRGSGEIVAETEHAMLLDLYRQTAGALQSFRAGAGASSPEDEDVMEFMPET